jgi:hypothetical protein
MFTIPLKNSSGTLTLLENGLLEIKKVDMIILISKGSMHRVNITTDGKIVIYQSNTTYSTDYDIRVDKCHIPKVHEMMNTYMAEYADMDLADIYVKLNQLTERMDKFTAIDSEINSSIEIMKDYRTSISMLSKQLIMMSDFNVENIQRIDEKFRVVNTMINSIQANINTDNTSPIVYEEFELPVEEQSSNTPLEAEPSPDVKLVNTFTFFDCFKCYIISLLILASVFYSMSMFDYTFEPVPVATFEPVPVFEPVAVSSIYGVISNANDTLEAL